MLCVAVNCHFEEIGTLKLVGLRAVTCAPLAHVAPLFKVFRFVETHVLVGAHDHHPFVLRCIPEHLRVAEILQSVEGCNHGVALVFSVSATVVEAVGDALLLALVVAGQPLVRGVESNDSVLAKACRVVVVNHARAREYVAHGVACNSRLLVCPVHEVLRHRVAPVHVAPL